jgi:hypothetical protein
MSKRIRAGRAGLLISGMLLAAALPAVSRASSVDIARYLAAPGELNRITIDKGASDFTYTDPGAIVIDPGASSCSVAGDQATCPWLSAAFAPDVFAGDGADTITDTQGGRPFELDGGTGDDLITASEYLPVTGGPGNDHLLGGPRSDTLLGGARADDAGNVPAPQSTWLPDNDTIEGLGGGDLLYGNVGDDVIDGGDGNDNLEGDDGNDVERGGPGDDFIDGLPGSCCSTGDQGSDVLDGGDGNDQLVGSRDNGAPDTYSCGSGSDLAEVGVGDQVQSDCEQVDEYEECPGGGGCTLALVVTAPGPVRTKASAARSKRHGRTLILGSQASWVPGGAKREIAVRLLPARVNKALARAGRASAVIQVKLLKKKSKPKRISRTPFAIRR